MDTPKNVVKFSNFKEFYPFYLHEHSNRTNRRLHFVGTTLALVALVWVIRLQNPKYIPVVPFAGYFFAWIGHFFFQKNKPATFQYPLYSLMGDFRMYYEMLTGKIKF